MSYAPDGRIPMRPSGSPEELERRRLRAIALLQHGMAPVEVARHVGVDRRSVRRWRASHDRAGRAGVGAKPAPGRPPKLDARRRARLERVLLRGAEAAGFSTPLWTCPRVADLVRREFGVRYHVDHIGRVLRTLLRGQDPQGRQACRPAPRAADAAGVRHQPQDSPGPGTDDPPVGPHQGGSRDRVVDDRREDATSTST